MFYKAAVYRPALLVLYVPRAWFARVVRLDFARRLFSGSKGASLPRVHRQDHPPPCRLSFPGLQEFLYSLTALSLPFFPILFPDDRHPLVSATEPRLLRHGDLRRV